MANYYWYYTQMLGLSFSLNNQQLCLIPSDIQKPGLNIIGSVSEWQDDTWLFIHYRIYKTTNPFLILKLIGLRLQSFIKF